MFLRKPRYITIYGRRRANPAQDGCVTKSEYCPSNRGALTLARAIATSLDTRLTLLRVVPLRDLPVLIHETTESLKVGNAQVALAEATRVANSLGVSPKIRLKRDRAADQIFRCVATLRPDLLVMGPRGP
jgi:hypothetical protein